MKNKKRFAEIVATLGAVFQREVEKPLVRIYWEVLSKYSDEQIEAACKAALSRCKFFPKPAEIEELIPSGGMSPPEAWGAVMEALEFGKESADRQVNEAVRRVGGWGYLKEKTNDELQWISKRFVEHYNDLQDQNRLRIAQGLPAPKVQKLIEQATSKET